MKIWIILAFICIIHSALSDVKSSNGVINFDLNSDNHPDAILNATGLAIGNFMAEANLHIHGNSMIQNKLTVGTSISNSSNLYIQGTFGHNFETLQN